MGCCSSTCVDDDFIEPNERTRLLNNDENLNEDSNQNFHMISQLREQEKLKQIVQKTAENLIDISNIRTFDRLQQQDIIERTREYQEIIMECESQNEIKEKINKLPMISNNNKNFFENINGFASLVSSSIKNEEKSQLSNIINEIQDSLNEIKVEDVGEFIIAFE
jgi:argonaute-like protein implicated in RNA metabolism and viral defense